jgi:hypothetical protein
VRSFVTFTAHHILLELSDKGELEGAHGMCYIGGRKHIHIGISWGNQRERGHMQDQGVDGRIIKWTFNTMIQRRLH